MSETTARPLQTALQIAVLYCLGVLAATTVSEAIPLLDGIAGDLHPSSPAMVGLVMSLPGLVVAVGALLAGHFVDRFGDKLMMSIGAAILVVGDVAVSLAQSIPTMLWGRFLSGCGYVLMTVAAVTLLMRLTSGKQRTIALALWSTYVPMSFILPFVVAGVLVKFGWRATFASHAALIVVLQIVGLLIFPAAQQAAAAVDEPKGSHTAGLASVLRSPWPYLLGISFGADSFLHTGITSTLAQYLHGHYGADPIVINHWTVGAMVMNMLGCLLLGQLLHREVSPTGVLIVALLITGIPGLAMYALPIGTTWSIICCYVLMFGSGVLTGMWSYVPSISPSPQAIGSTSGLIMQLTLFGVLLSGPIFFTAMASSSRAVLLVVGIALLCCCARTPIILRNRKRTTSGVKVPEGVAAH